VLVYHLDRPTRDAQADEATVDGEVGNVPQQISIEMILRTARDGVLEGRIHPHQKVQVSCLTHEYALAVADINRVHRLQAADSLAYGRSAHTKLLAGLTLRGQAIAEIPDTPNEPMCRWRGWRARHVPDAGAEGRPTVVVPAGLAAVGFVLWVSSFAAFIASRDPDQIRIVVTQPRLNVTLAGGYSGILTIYRQDAPVCRGHHYLPRHAEYGRDRSGRCP
jgi:hypothetical protein